MAGHPVSYAPPGVLFADEGSCVSLGPHRPCSHQDDVAQPAEETKQTAVALVAQGCGNALVGCGSVEAGDEVETHPRAVGRVSVQGEQILVRPIDGTRREDLVDHGWLNSPMLCRR